MVDTSKEPANEVTTVHKPTTLKGLEDVIRGKLQAHVSNIHIANALKDIGEALHHFGQSVEERFKALEARLEQKLGGGKSPATAQPAKSAEPSKPPQPEQKALEQPAAEAAAPATPAK